MSTVFGVQGPKDVTVLSYPTRSQDRGVPTAAAARPSIDSDLAVEHEKADQFDMNATPAKKTWAAAHAARMISVRRGWVSCKLIERRTGGGGGGLTRSQSIDENSCCGND